MSHEQLLARFAPALVFTAGEMFFSTGVDGYLARCSLWAQPAEGRPRRLAGPGELIVMAVVASVLLVVTHWKVSLVLLIVGLASSPCGSCGPGVRIATSGR